MCAARRTWRQGGPRKRRQSSKKSWTIAASFLAIQSVRWCTCNSAGQSVHPGIRPRLKVRTRTSSLSGKKPTLTSPSSSKPKPSTQGCNDDVRLELLLEHPRHAFPPVESHDETTFCRHAHARPSVESFAVYGATG